MTVLKLFGKTPQDLRILRGPFKGARVYLNPSNSMRKLFGLYEYVLNDWISEVGPQKDFAFDVGSNSGYDLYGLAHLLSHQNKKSVDIIGFEPGASNIPELLKPKEWKEYSNCRIEIIEKFAGAEDSGDTVTLDNSYSERNSLTGKRGLIKIDVEGAEVEVLHGATDLLNNLNHDWLIEIHGKDLIPKVCEFFTDRGRPFLLREMYPLPIIGSECRQINTYWLTTIGIEC